MQRSILIYLVCTTIILSWWILAFKHSFQSPLTVTFQQSTLTHFSDHDQDTPLSKLSRNTLHKALLGDYTLMARLIFDWEIDACLLESQGHKNIKHLPLTAIGLSQQLARNIKKNNAVHSNHYLPQTHASAAVLLALLPPEQLIGLPKGLREEEALYPKTLTSKIPLTIDRHHAEEIYLEKPAAAFVSATYSHPAMLETLTRQGIALVLLQPVKNVNDIIQMVLRLGYEVDRPMQAKLLSIFIEAALLAIDNRLALLDIPGDLNMLYVNYYSRYYLPSPSTVTWDLLIRLGLQPKKHSLALDLEHFLEIDPQYLIVSSTEVPINLNLINYPLNQLKAAKEGRLFYLQDKIQQSPTQYVVLAYYDLAQAIAQTRSL